MNKLIRINSPGKVMVVTDLHGNLEDYRIYEDIWIEYLDKGNYVVVTGDFIHPMGQESDGSLEILESLMKYFDEHPKFILLLGNHELSQLKEQPIYKMGIDQQEQFLSQVEGKFGSRAEIKMHQYLNFFRKLPVAVKTSNKIFISHSGPSPIIRNLKEVMNITEEGYGFNRKLDDLLWNRPGHFTPSELNKFLINVGCQFQVVGHTPVAGYKIIHEKQMIISSSFSQSQRAYLDIDLKKDIRSAPDMISMIKYLP